MENKNLFEEVVNEIRDIHERKESDYGNAFDRIFERDEKYEKGAGMKYAFDQISQKFMRLESLILDGKCANFESIDDSLRDMASYCIMTLAIKRKNGE